MPYERPALSKGYLAGRDTFDELLVRSEAADPEHCITLRLGLAATGWTSTGSRWSSPLDSALGTRTS